MVGVPSAFAFIPSTFIVFLCICMYMLKILSVSFVGLNRYAFECPLH